MEWGSGAIEIGLMVVVDSSVWISFFNGNDTWQTRLLDELLAEIPIIMGDIILTEVLQGFQSDRDFKSAENYLSVLPFRLMGGFDLAIQSAKNYRLLRKKGVTVRKTIDVIIGTFCIMENLILLHDDHDFDSMADLLSLQVLICTEVP